MTSWLNKQRKQALLELGAEAGLKQDEDLRKDELVENLDAYLQKNATKLSGKTAFEPYYGTRRTPFKARGSSAAGATSDDGEVKSVVKARGRRTTKVKQETDDDEEEGAASPSSALVTTSRTPARPRRRSELLPASPADVADDVEYAARRVATGMSNLYQGTGIMEKIDSLREVCSSVTAVQMTFTFLEAWCLQRQVLPMRKAFDLPSINLFGVSSPSVPIGLTDFFRLLEPEFWSTSMLWSMTSIFIPLLVAYFFNLSARDVKRHGSRVSVNRYRVDPLTFSIAKAITTFVVYGLGKPLPFFDMAAAAHVNGAMFYGWRGIIIGSFVGIITSLYEAAQGQ